MSWVKGRLLDDSVNEKDEVTNPEEQIWKKWSWSNGLQGILGRGERKQPQVKNRKKLPQ